jgi:nitrogen fixation NifU-like protein
LSRPRQQARDFQLALSHIFWIGSRAIAEHRVIWLRKKLYQFCCNVNGFVPWEKPGFPFSLTATKKLLYQYARMNDPFEKFTDHLQQEINEEVIQTYGEQVYERWRNPRFRGQMERPTGYSRTTGSCGDTVEVFLRVKQGVVLEASFTTTGCGSSVVCASVACELAIGKMAEDVKDVTGEMILEVLEGLPEDNVHCAFLAAETLQAALDACTQPE